MTLKRLHVRTAPPCFQMRLDTLYTHIHTHTAGEVAWTGMMVRANGVSPMMATNGRAATEWCRLKTPIMCGVIHMDCTPSTPRGLQTRVLQCTRTQAGSLAPSQFLRYACGLGPSKYKIADELNDEWKRLTRVCKRARKRGTPEARNERAQTRNLQRQVKEAEVSFAPGGAEFAKLAEHFKELAEMCKQ